MFPTSSQLKFWTFSGTTELTKLRIEANSIYVKKHGADYEESYKESYFLTAAEERMVLRHYEYVLKDFCNRFQPPMPKYVAGTSMMFLKRFYLHKSIMDYHPKDMVYTCVYLACKVEEFNVSMMQFVGNLHGDRERATDVLLAQELLLMQHLHYHLTIHNCWRPLEGFLIDIKTRFPELEQPEKLRKGAEDFIDRTLNTDVALIFAPSQIALAAILSSASKMGMNLDRYVTDTLLRSGTVDNIKKSVEHIKRIRSMVRHQDPLEREQVRPLEAKLEKCRNQENNPDSEVYKAKLRDLWEDEEDRMAKRKMQKTQDSRLEDLVAP